MQPAAQRSTSPNFWYRRLIMWLRTSNAFAISHRRVDVGALLGADQCLGVIAKMMIQFGLGKENRGCLGLVADSAICFIGLPNVIASASQVPFWTRAISVSRRNVRERTISSLR